MRESVEITMLGKFTIFGPGMAAPKAVSLTGRARRLWILTAYLILNRERGVSARELIDLLWPDSESSDPMATLQNNVSRARNALEELGLRDGKKLICNRSGTYYWAPNTETVLDCEQFRTALRACLDEVAISKMRLWRPGPSECIPTIFSRNAPQTAGASIQMPIITRPICSSAGK